MKKTLMVLFLSVSVCGLFGCASSKPSDEEEAAYPPRKAGTAETPKENRTNVKIESRKPVAAKPVADKTQKIENVETPVTDTNVAAKPVEMKVANALERNPYLSSKLEPLLPRRMTLTDAAARFKNQKQFIAALHVSRNLGIPFDQIKAKMTGEKRMSLNDALRELRPEMTKNLAKAEAKKGEGQAEDDEDQAKDEAKKAAQQEKLANK